MNDACRCDGCAALMAECGADAPLLDLYRRKLLIRGWAGTTTPAEKRYMRAHAPWVQAAVARGAAHLRSTATGQRENPYDSGQTPVPLSDNASATA